MKEKYERLSLTVTLFDEEDVIVTSTYDRNNAYRNIDDLGNSGGRQVPGTWS